MNLRIVLLVVLPLVVSGCAARQHGNPGLGGPLARHHGAGVLWSENPALIPTHDREFLWNQIVDTVDDYFVIEREDRVRQIGNTLTEGRINTFPQVGATSLEPWRRDSTKGFERRLATLQTIRRFAIVRVWPAEGGYRVEVAVFKELEDLDSPEFAPVGGDVFRHDGTLVRAEDREEGPVTLGWIPQGRDPGLEQQILLEIQARAGALH